MHSLRPEGHAREQLPALHVALPPAAAGHTFAQRPQCSALVRRFVSHPLLGSPSQSPKPALHERVHPPATHRAAWLGPAVHTVPHVPQFMTLAAVLVSHPFAALLSQSPKPAEHVSPHVPVVHTAVAFAPPAHTRPHAPQLLVSADIKFTHTFEQLVVGGSHRALHVPALQNCPAGHMFPHRPQ